MLEQVYVGIASIGWYERSAGAKRIGQLRTLATPLLQHPEEGKAIRGWGWERVREHFQLPRPITDELRLYGALLRT
jgi:hypothetical protein